jgi:prepilin-type N-terminal cleavage/methylation domain-containing protein
MKTHLQSIKAGFTIVEIMVVVVIVSLMASLAIPAFKAFRESTIQKQVLNDGRLIGQAAQQYMMEYGVAEVAFSIDADGQLRGPLSEWIRKLSPGVSSDGEQLVQLFLDGEAAYALNHPQLKNPVSFDAIGVPLH